MSEAACRKLQSVLRLHAIVSLDITKPAEMLILGRRLYTLNVCDDVFDSASESALMSNSC